MPSRPFAELNTDHLEAALVAWRLGFKDSPEFLEVTADLEPDARRILASDGPIKLRVLTRTHHGPRTWRLVGRTRQTHHPGAEAIYLVEVHQKGRPDG